MRLILASRKSDLARIQAYSVGDALKKAHPDLEIAYSFRESLGDKNLEDPLWQMPEKGVFTQDFHDDLVSGKVDLVVHSWKDLPTQSPLGTEIVATTNRADMRDLFLFRKDRWQQVKTKSVLKIYSSSPRRAYNLESFFKQGFPVPLERVTFEPVRGNVPTRIAKLLGGDVDGLIVAKAALDRLLSAEEPEFFDTKKKLREALARCWVMVIPLRQNPSAAAQGALAVEVATLRKDVKSLLRGIHDVLTFQTVMNERGILSGLGGGCHQKIGISCLKRPYGDLTIVKAHTDSGLKIDRVEFKSVHVVSKASKERIFPLEPGEQSWFDREVISGVRIPKGPLWVAKAQALPENYSPGEGQLIWVSGWETWKKLAERGVWVTGSSESLGETEDPRLDILLNESPKWTKLSHSGVEGALGTYKLIPREEIPNLAGRTHFYWTSGTSFERALQAFPDIKKAHHACGPGNTYLRLQELLGGAPVWIFPSHELWLKEVQE